EDALTAIDPVCGMSVRPDSPHRTAHAGAEVRFCSARCLERFRGDPDRFAAGAPPPAGPVSAAPAAPAAAGATYPCPTPPGVRQIGPGSCPICGMALEPLLATGAGEPDDGELRDLTRR